MQQGNKDISVIGGGLAGLSLLHYLLHTDPTAAPRLLGPLSPAADTPHIWGFWKTHWLDEAAALSRKSWSCWQIITDRGRITQQAQHRPYHVIDSTVWLGHCLKTVRKSAVSHDPQPLTDNVQTSGICFDSRPPKTDRTVMLQHFHGFEIEAAKPVFTPDVMILMDFRCDQSKGIHFIYLLPFSSTNALVESTLFSFTPLSADYYHTAINTYLNTHYQLNDFQILRREKGVIPMGFFPVRDRNLLAVGANGGCIRPSSGYAFSAVQRQSQQIARLLAAGKPLNAQRDLPAPHRWLDCQLDRIFLAVLAQHPQRAPELFLQLGRQMSGDNFAAFMSGQASISDYSTLIAAMPRGIFIAAALELLTRRLQK